MAGAPWPSYAPPDLWGIVAAVAAVLDDGERHRRHLVYSSVLAATGSIPKTIENVIGSLCRYGVIDRATGTFRLTTLGRDWLACHIEAR